jgi:hypothetical protein
MHLHLCKMTLSINKFKSFTCENPLILCAGLICRFLLVFMSLSHEFPLWIELSTFDLCCCIMFCAELFYLAHKLIDIYPNYAVLKFDILLTNSEEDDT